MKSRPPLLPGQHRREYLRNSPPKSSGRSESSPHSRKPPKRKSAKRASEVERSMGSTARRKFVATLPCSACGILGYSQNAHVVKGNRGMGYKGDAKFIAPLCGAHFSATVGGLAFGCHELYDEFRPAFDGLFPTYDAVAEAAKCDARCREIL